MRFDLFVSSVSPWWTLYIRPEAIHESAMGEKQAINTANRLVVVTGTSKGVGRETAKALVLQHGCNVIGVARDAKGLESLMAECTGGTGAFEPLAADLADDLTIGLVKKQVAGRRLHGLVNNAGLLITRPFGEWTTEDGARLFHLNATVPMLLAQALADSLAGDPPGHIVGIGSMGGFQGSAKFAGLLAYSASKAALACVCECLAEELKDKGVRANSLCLGSVDTDMLRAAFPGYQAPITPVAMGAYVARFVLEGHSFYNGKVLPLALSTP